MGLDISAASNIEIFSFERMDEDDEWGAYEKGIHTDYINPDFPHAVPAEWFGNDVVVWGNTRSSQNTSFRAGSYSGYGVWRGELAEFSFSQNTYHDNGVWIDIQDGQYDDFPFVELINFSDCEGCFYGSVCAKLYLDFVDNREAYFEHIENHEGIRPYYKGGYTELYDEWTKAFRYASNDGIVSFH